MTFMNEYEIENLYGRFNSEETPNLLEGARVLTALKDWANRNSDGWCYWPKPCRAAKGLQIILSKTDRYHFDVQDISTADLKKALSPIKAFLTRQGVDHAEVL